MHNAAEVTNLLRAWSNGDRAALDRLAEGVYGELHRMARRFMKNERRGHSQQATAFVHEVYFGGLTEEDIATVLDISPRTVRRDCEFARVWLARELAHSSRRRA